MSSPQQSFASTATMNKEEKQLIISNSAEETEQFGYKLAPQLKPGDVLAFFGDLGSGKSTLIKGICKGLGVEADITSPTFTLIHEYSARLPVFHFDFYRIANSHEVWELGSDEYFYGEGVCLIEWADRISDFLPENRIEIHLKNCFQKGLQNIREIRTIRK